MFVGPRHAGEAWTDILRARGGRNLEPNNSNNKQQGNHVTITIDKRGYAEFAVGAMGVAVWVEVGAVEDAGLARIVDEFESDIYRGCSY
ncbi:hypothetical protein BJX64DRAFT_270135 [Aspergillus heterothallicus]